VWAVEAPVERLRCVHVWTAADVAGGEWPAAIRTAAPGRNETIAGRAWATGAAAWMPDETAARPADDRAGGFQATCAIPFAFGGHTVAVVQFWAREARPRDDRWLQMIEGLHQLVVHLVARRSAERALQDVAQERHV
jgi:hypothetical protein